MILDRVLNVGLIDNVGVSRDRVVLRETVRAMKILFSSYAFYL